MSIASSALGPDYRRRLINLGHSGLLPELLSVRDTEAVLRLSHASIYGLIKSGKLDALKVGNATRITRQSIEQLINSSPRVRDKLLVASAAEPAEPVHSPETGCHVSNAQIEPRLPADRPPARGLTEAKPDNRQQHDQQALRRPEAGSAGRRA